MVSWSDRETNSESLLSDFDSVSDLSPDHVRVPESIFDPDFTGVSDGPQRCRHHLPCERFVSFESTNTGRRFLACGSKGTKACETVYRIDGEWPVPMKNAIKKLQMYEEEKDSRIIGNVAYSTENYKLVLDKMELERKNLELHKELGNKLTVEQVARVTSSDLEVEKAMRKEAHGKIAALKEEKKKLEYYIADLLKAEKGNKKKLKKIFEICQSE